MFHGFKDLADILETRYGVGPGATGIAEAAIWSAEELLKCGFTKEQAKAQLSAYNRFRNRLGKVLAYPCYGSALF